MNEDKSPTLKVSTAKEFLNEYEDENPDSVKANPQNDKRGQ